MPGCPVRPSPCRHQRQQLIQLQQVDGATFWVALPELAANAACLLLAHDTAEFAQQQHLRRLDAATAPRQQLLVLNTAEPATILVSLNMAPQHMLQPKPPAKRQVGSGRSGRHMTIWGVLLHCVWWWRCVIPCCPSFYLGAHLHAGSNSGGA